MKRQSALTASLLLLAMVGSPAHSAAPPGERDAAGLIVTVHSQLEGTPWIGSGLIIGEKEGKIYFAVPNHLVRGESEAAESIEIKLESTQERGLAAELLPFKDKALDLAVVRLSASKLPNFSIASIPFSRLGDPAALKKGDDLFHIGTVATTSDVANAEPDSFARLDGSRIYFESKALMPGWSGAGLFDQHWRLVGLVRGIDKEGFGEAVNIEPLLQRLREEGLPVSFPRLPLPLEPRLNPETARARLDAALKAADLADHRATEALETLLFNGFRFNNSDLSALALNKAHLEGSDFTSTNFLGSEAASSAFDNSTLDGAKLSFSTLDHASFRKVTAQRAFFEFTKANFAVFADAKLAQSSFFMSSLQGANFAGANLRGAALAYCDLRGADFSGANLEGTIFYSSVLDGAKFDGAIIKNTDVGSAVADKVTFTESQRAELRRSAPLDTWIDIQADWNTNHPDVNSFYIGAFRKLPEHDQKSLSFRDQDSPQPVGALRYFRREGQNKIGAHYWFKEPFWTSGSNAARVKGRVEQHANLMLNLLTSMRPIEGSGAQLSSWLKEIKERSTKFEPKTERLILTDDAFLVLLLARNVISPVEIKDDDWSSEASARCHRDSYMDESVFPDSWGHLYPRGVVCDALQKEHVDFYRRWTVGRSRALKTKAIEIIYPIQAYNFQRMQPGGTGDGPKGRLRLLFANLENTYEHLAESMRTERSSKWMNSEARTTGRDGVLRLPHESSRYAVSIDPEALFSESTEFVQLYVTFELGPVSKDPEPRALPEDILIDVKPERAWIEAEGKKVWEGAIQLLP